MGAAARALDAGLSEGVDKIGVGEWLVSAAMFIVVNDPSATDDLVRFLSDHGCRARTASGFVVQIEFSPREVDVEGIVERWRSARRGSLTAELVTPHRHWI